MKLLGNSNNNFSPTIPIETSVNSLGRDGLAYHIMQVCFFLFPLLFSTFVWYVFFYEVDPEEVPVPIVLLCVVGFLIFLHQQIDVYRFLRVASRTAKKIGLTDDVLTLTLFSNKRVDLKHYTISSEANRYSNISIHRKLFPKGSDNLSLYSCGQEYLISSTTDNYDGLRRSLGAKCHGQKGLAFVKN